MMTIGKILTIILVTFAGQVSAQTEMLKEIRISRGHFKPFCGKCRAYHDIYFDKQLEFNAIDSTLWFRKKEKKRFNKIDSKAPTIFLNRETYTALDSLHEDFTYYRTWGEKFSVYKIELVYYSSKGQLPHKIKTMMFLYNPFIKEGESRNIVEKVIDEYLIIMKNAL
jgi:hypothetical protein